MSAPNRNIFSTPPPGYEPGKRQSTDAHLGQSPVNSMTNSPISADRYALSFAMPPPPPPPSTPSTPKPKKTPPDSYQRYNASSNVNVQQLNKNSSYLNYQKPKYNRESEFSYIHNPTYETRHSSTNSGSNASNASKPSSDKVYSSTATTTAVSYSTNRSYSSAPGSSLLQYSNAYSPQTLSYSGISYPPPPLTSPVPSQTPPMAFTPNLPPPSIQYSLNPAAYYVPTQPSKPNTGNSYQQQNGYGYHNGYNSNTRKRLNSVDQQMTRMVKKKKKPLSQAGPLRKDWSVEDAVRALNVEKEFNKLNKSPSLIIKFPDLELNRDIVQKFNPKIESVHFQQPSTPRYCFVTLRKDADTEKVIQELNKTKFGDGYLSAEHKKDREETENIGPEDIDPLTLYVGNLAQEVTVEDVHRAYPKHKRVDIGFAKKMKYTRYAFVCFRNADDAIEAFQNTHATEMYNKSLIVRFRRLHGTVGLPGETKLQNSKSDRRSDSDIDKSKDTNLNQVNMEIERSESSINLNETEDEEDHRTVMQRYIDRVKRENPHIEENEDWYYSDEEEASYDPLPDWLSRTSSTNDSIESLTSTNERASRERSHREREKEKIQTSKGYQVLDHIPKVEIKSEPPDDYYASVVTSDVSCQNVMVKKEPDELSTDQRTSVVLTSQPSVEIDHRPMLEPKLEIADSVASINTSQLNEEVLHKPMLEPKLERTEAPSDPMTSQLNEEILHRPMWEPKPEPVETPQALEKTSLEGTMEPEIHKPMLEPKTEAPESSRVEDETILITDEESTSQESNIFTLKSVKKEKIDESNETRGKTKENTDNRMDIREDINSTNEAMIIKEETTGKNGESLNKNDEEDSSSEEEDSSFDLNNFLCNIKTGKTFL